MMQLSTFKTDYLVDCFSLREFIRQENPKEGIKAIFSDENITKVLHSADSDLKYLISDFGIVTINMFDTSKALLFL